MDTLKKSTYLVMYKSDEIIVSTHKVFYAYDSDYNIEGTARIKEIILCKPIADLVLDKKMYDSLADMPHISTFEVNTIVYLRGNNFPIYIINPELIQYLKFHKNPVYGSGVSLRNNEIFFKKGLTINDAIGLTAFTALVTWLLYEIIKK